MEPLKTPELRLLPVRLTFQDDARLGRDLAGWQRVRFGLRSLRCDLLIASYKWRSAFRSFVGHIQTLSPKGRPSLLIAIQSPLVPEGSWEDSRQVARTVGIRKLEATCPWVDIVDRHMFLMGFDEAEEFYLRTMGKERNTQTWLAS